MLHAGRFVGDHGCLHLSDHQCVCMLTRSVAALLVWEYDFGLIKIEQLIICYAGIVDEVFEFLVARIENSLRELLEEDLALYPVDKWKTRGWDFMDSMDPNREWDGFSYVDMPSPLKGMEVRVRPEWVGSAVR